jgi:hypothetical protein
MDFNKFFQSKAFKTTLWVMAGLIASLFIFKAGTIAGFKKASFSYRWGENYHRNFGGPRGGFLGDFGGGDFIGAHGVFGQIMKIDSSAGSTQATLVIRGSDGVEKIALIKEDTTIKRFRETVKISGLKVDDYMVAIGEPNDAGEIEAKFIRLLPSPAAKTPPKPLSPRARRQ